MTKECVSDMTINLQKNTKRRKVIAKCSRVQNFVNFLLRLETTKLASISLRLTKNVKTFGINYVS